MDINIYGSRLMYAMGAKQTSRKDLAAALEISVQAVGDVIRGKSSAFTAENNAKAAQYLGVNPNWLATGAEPMEAGTATANITAPSFSLTATATPSNPTVAPVVTAQADTNTIAEALAVIQKHTQRLSILDPPSRDLVQDLMQDCIKRPELAAYLDSVIERVFTAFTAKQHTPDHRRTGTAD